MFHLLHGLGWHSSQCWVKEPQIWKQCLQNNWNIVHMDVKPKYKQPCTYTSAKTCNKAENFQWILWTRQSAFLRSPWPWPQWSGTGAGIILNKTLNLQVSETTLKSIIIFLYSSYPYALKWEAPNGEHTRITSTSRVYKLGAKYSRWKNCKKKKKNTPPEIEPGTPAWQSSTLPRYHNDRCCG